LRRLEDCGALRIAASPCLRALLAGRAGALLLILMVTLALWQRSRVEDFASFDQKFYLGIAHDLLETGRFTDGFMFAAADASGERPSGMRFAPLYPALLAAAAWAEPGLRSGMDCLVARQAQGSGCPAEAATVRGVQFAALVLVLWLVWWMGGAAGGPVCGWLSLGVAFGAVPLLLRSVNYLMTEMIALALCVGAMAAGVRAVLGGRRTRWAGLAGACLGLAVLTRPGFLYLVPAAAVAALLLGRRPARAPVLAFAVCAALVVGPWICRNAAVLGRLALTHGYDSHTLVQRIAFDTMTKREYAVSFLCWLPDGNEMGAGLLGRGACDRFGWDEHQNSFYALGLRHMLPQTLAAAGGYDHHLGYLIRTYILASPLRFAMVSLPLALRGAYVAHWWGVVLLGLALLWTARAIRGSWPAAEGGREVFLAIALPAWFMLAFNAAVAVNQPRYNLMLIPAYAIAGGLTLRGLAGRVAPGRAGLPRVSQEDA
jgi:4-amino-4-deoxy-L-arabinose transferase-like glycosyltransferase